VTLQYLQLWEIVQGVVTTPSVPDAVVWRWSSNRHYSAASAYDTMFIGAAAPFGASLIWNSRAPPKVRFFFWLALHGCCWTANRRMRHGLQDNDACVMCLQSAETLDHIALGCVISRQVWVCLLSRIGLMHLVAMGDVDVFAWWASARRRVPKACRKGFNTLVMLTVWVLWKEHNTRTFGGLPSDPPTITVAVLQEAKLWLWAGYSALASLLGLM
jgi:hypothetical protein